MLEQRGVLGLPSARCAPQPFALAIERVKAATDLRGLG